MIRRTPQNIYVQIKRYIYYWESKSDCKKKPSKGSVETIKAQIGRGLQIKAKRRPSSIALRRRRKWKYRQNKETKREAKEMKVGRFEREQRTEEGRKNASENCFFIETLVLDDHPINNVKICTLLISSIRII